VADTSVAVLWDARRIVLAEGKAVMVVSAASVTDVRSELAAGAAGTSHRWRKLLLGDWGRFVRDPLDVMRIVFFVGTVYWVVTGGAAADGLVGASLVLIGGRVLNLPRFYDLSLIVGMTLTGWGSALHLYGQHAWYDDVVHALMPMLMTPIVYILLVRLEVLPQLEDLRGVHRQLGFFLIAFCAGMTIAGCWEVIEWWLDQWTGDTRVNGAADTASDLTSGVYGSIAAGLLLIAWNKLRLPLTRPSAEYATKWLVERGLVKP
jgi:hypothetical protein